jgi:hypothetical protein
VDYRAWQPPPVDCQPSQGLDLSALEVFIPLHDLSSNRHDQLSQEAMLKAELIERAARFRSAGMIPPGICTIALHLS